MPRMGPSAVTPASIIRTPASVAQARRHAKAHPIPMKCCCIMTKLLAYERRVTFITRATPLPQLPHQLDYPVTTADWFCYHRYRATKTIGLQQRPRHSDFPFTVTTPLPQLHGCRGSPGTTAVWQPWPPDSHGCPGPQLPLYHGHRATTTACLSRLPNFCSQLLGSVCPQWGNGPEWGRQAAEAPHGGREAGAEH